MAINDNFSFKRRLTVQSIGALLLIVSGVVMLMFSIYLPPQGEIHPSVLFAFGEILLAAGAFMGVDLHYSLRHYQEWVKKLKETEDKEIKDETV